MVGRRQLYEQALREQREQGENRRALIKLRIALARLAQKANIGSSIPGLGANGPEACFEEMTIAAHEQKSGWGYLAALLMDRISPLSDD